MKTIVWGVFLIVIGSLMLLERVGVLNVPVGSLWPLILFALAASNFAGRRIPAGVMFALLGTVFLACTFGLCGMSYHNSWPLLMVAAGVTIVLRAFLPEGPGRCRKDEVHNG